MNDSYNTRIDDNETYQPEGWGIRRDKDDPISRRAPESAPQGGDEPGMVAEQATEPRVIEAMASPTWPDRQAATQRTAVETPARPTTANPFFPDLIQPSDDDADSGEPEDQRAPATWAARMTSITNFLQTLPRTAAKIGMRARLAALAALVLILVVLAARLVASNFLHLHQFTTPATIGTLTRQPQMGATSLTLPKTPDIKQSFSAQYAGGGLQVQLLAQLGTGPTSWSAEDMQAVQNATGITIDPTTNVQENVDGVDMSCSTAVTQALGYVSICFWNNYDVRGVVLDLTSSGPGDAAAWSAQANHAIEG